MDNEKTRVEPGDSGYDRLIVYWNAQGSPRAPFYMDGQHFIPITDMIDNKTEWVFVKDGPPSGPESYYMSVSIGKH